MKKKVVVFSGAGISRESGIPTFRDAVDGTWENYNIDDVCTPSGWRRNREKVLNFYNERRRQLTEVEPNKAHLDLVRLEEKYDVTHVTQNVDDLFERAGCSNILHLHGEMTKARSSAHGHPETVIDIGYNDIKIGDKCEKTGSQLRPHIVWFDEFPFNVEEAYVKMGEADVLLVIGTSLSIGYTLPMLRNVKPGCKIYYIDPKPDGILTSYRLDVEYVKEPATIGVGKVVDVLLDVEYLY